jgi:predicted histone-like DNA-binding protein
MKYKLTKRTNPQNRKEEKWYASTVNEGRVSQKEISADIVALSSLARGDVSNVIDTVPKYLIMNRSVKIDGLGSFRITFTSEGVDDLAAFTADKIKGIRILFTPSTELR